MNTPTIVSLVLIVLGLALGRGVARFAAARTAEQPVSVNPRAESDVLGVVLGDLGRYAPVSVLRPGDFAVGVHTRIWAALQDTLGEGAATEEASEVPGIARRLRADQSALLAQVRSRLDASDQDAFDRLRTRELAAYDPTLLDQAEDVTSDEHTTDQERAGWPGLPELQRFAVEESGGYVLDAMEGRTRYQGARELTPSEDPERPLVRSLAPVSTLRSVATGVALALGGGLAPILARHALSTTPALILGGGAIVVLVYACVVASLVDIDTLYLDIPTLIVGGGLSTLLAWGAAALNHHPEWILHGIIMVIGTAAGFELINFVYTKLRHRVGLGRGDTYLSIATVGVPVALTGSYVLGYYGVMAGMLVGVGIFAVGAVSKRLTRDTPFAFGPGLAAGWIVAYAAVVAGLHP